MSKVIVCTMPDGSLQVNIPATGGRFVRLIRTEHGERAFAAPGIPADRLTNIPHEVLDQEDEAAWLKRVAERSVPPDAVRSRIVNVSELPTDREHRDAWVDDGQRIYVDESRIRRPEPELAPATGELDLRPYLARLRALEQAKPISPQVHLQRYDDSHLLMLIGNLAQKLEALEAQSAPAPERVLPDLPPEPEYERDPEPERAWSIRDVLRSAEVDEDGPLPELPPVEDYPDLGVPGDDELTTLAIQRLNDVAEALKRAALGGSGGQTRFETAVKAKNGTAGFAKRLEPEAAASGLMVIELAERIISERDAADIKVLKIDAALAKAYGALEVAAPEQVDQVVQQALVEMRAA